MQKQNLCRRSPVYQELKRNSICYYLVFIKFYLHVRPMFFFFLFLPQVAEPVLNHHENARDSDEDDYEGLPKPTHLDSLWDLHWSGLRRDWHGGWLINLRGGAHQPTTLVGMCRGKVEYGGGGGVSGTRYCEKGSTTISSVKKGVSGTNIRNSELNLWG